MVSVVVTLTLMVSPGQGPTASRPLPATILAKNRVLFNGDCTFLFGDAFVTDLKGHYTKETPRRFIDLLADSGVDTYLCNFCAQVPWYPSKRTPSILAGYRRGDREFVRSYFRPGLPKERLEPAIDDLVVFLNRYLDLAEDGVNWIDEVSMTCRRRGIAPWLSVRMNDAHGANNWDTCYMNCALQRDPKYRLSGRQPNPKDGIKSFDQLMDFRHKEVRDYFQLMTREALEDHDFEGLELDWFRHPYCVEPPATQAQIDTMTQWHAEVRKLTEAKAKKLGKPVPFGLRVPIRLGQLKAIGLDVKAMVDAGLIDFVNFSNGWQTSWDVPYDELRQELGPRVAIYGVIEAAPNWMNARDPVSGNKGYRMQATSEEFLRGNVAGKLVMGVHGIETFNFFCSDEVGHNPLWNKGHTKYRAHREMRDLDKLRGQPKQYTLASANGAFAIPVYEYADQLPTSIEPDTKRPFRLSMCAEPADAKLELVVQVVVEKTDVVPEIGVSVNGCWPRFDGVESDRLVFPTSTYTHHVPENRAYDFRLPVSHIRDGWNEVLVYNGSHKKGTLMERRANTLSIVGLDLAVRPTK
jgi:hypothetical protein